jgi:hypothetical protein
VEIKGTIEAEGVSYVPTVAYVWIHLDQVSLNGKEAFTAVASEPDGKAADTDGSQKNVTGNGQLNVITPKQADLYKIPREGVIIV